jgi:hypothetical protein
MVRDLPLVELRINLFSSGMRCAGLVEKMLAIATDRV